MADISQKEIEEALKRIDVPRENNPENKGAPKPTEPEISMDVLPEPIPKNKKTFFGKKAKDLGTQVSKLEKQSEKAHFTPIPAPKFDITDKKILMFSIILGLVIPLVIAGMLNPVMWANPSVFTFVFMVIFVTMMVVIAFLMLLSGRVRQSYPMVAILRERRGNAVQVSLDRARLVRTGQGVYSLELKHKKVKTKAVDYRYIDIMQGGSGFIEIYIPHRGEYYPISFTAPDVVQANPENMRAWFVYQIRHNRDAMETKWEKFARVFAPIGAFMIIGVVSMLVLYVTWDGMSRTANAIGGVSQQLAHASETLASRFPIQSVVIQPVPSDIPPPTLPANTPPPQPPNIFGSILG